VFLQEEMVVSPPCERSRLGFGKPLDQPLTGRTRWGIGLVGDLERILTPSVIRQIEWREAPGFDISPHHRLRHAAPPQAGQQQCTLGGKVPDPPDIARDDSISPPVDLYRLGKNNLKMVAGSSYLGAACQC
jgi:hypothetical protein